VGEIIGLFINGWVSERFGYRYTVMACLVAVAAFTSIFFTAQNVQTLLVAEILCGIVRFPSFPSTGVTLCLVPLVLTT
jgi:MFS transporter, SP family, general alpha glucoside:H+ symporter